jgi:hypothetical protein
LLWRLPHLGLELPSLASAVTRYAEKFFARDGFRLSLTEFERELRA